MASADRPFCLQKTFEFFFGFIAHTFVLWKVMASDYFNTNQALEMVLRDGSDLEDEESLRSSKLYLGRCSFLS